MRVRSRDDVFDDSIISPIIVAIEEAAEAAGWGCLHPLPWLGRSALLQHGQARIAITVPRRQAEIERIRHQRARLSALGIRGLWLVPPGVPPELVDDRAVPCFALSDGRVSVPGHQAPLLADFIKGLLAKDLRWSEGLCASLYGLWIETQTCPSCETSSSYPTGALWLEGARYDRHSLWSVPPIAPTPLAPDSVEDLVRAIQRLAAPAHLTRDHLGIGAHCPACGCVLPPGHKDWRFASGYLLPLSVSPPVKPRGWWAWQGWPQAITEDYDPEAAELMWNYR